MVEESESIEKLLNEGKTTTDALEHPHPVNASKELETSDASAIKDAEDALVIETTEIDKEDSNDNGAESNSKNNGSECGSKNNELEISCKDNGPENGTEGLESGSRDIKSESGSRNNESDSGFKDNQLESVSKDNGLDSIAGSSDSTTMDTESAESDLDELNTTVTTNMEDDDSCGVMSYSGVTAPEDPVVTRVLPQQLGFGFASRSDDQLSLQSFNSESSAATLSSDHSGQRPKYLSSGALVAGPDSSEEDNLLSELESELLINGGAITHNRVKELSGFSDCDRPSGRRRIGEASEEFYRIQLDVLHQNIASLHQEVASLKASLTEKALEHKEILTQCKADYVAKLEKLVKQYESAKREKETMVVRYAQSEKEVIVLKKTKEDLERRLNDVARDREGLQGKLRVLHVDRVRACSSLDNKMGELANTQRENEKLREELNSRDIKIKWSQKMLKTETDSHKETQSKLEQSVHRLKEIREESVVLRRDCQEMIRQYQEAEEIKSVSLDIQLKEKLSELEVQKQERTDQEEVFGLLRQELDGLKKRQKVSVEENNTLTIKIQTLERERLEYEQTLSKLKDSQSTLRQEVVDLNTRLSEMENLRQQLDRQKDRVTAAQKEAERVRISNTELQADMDACHVKEGELLEFTERLTSKSMLLQSEHSLLEVKAQSLEEDKMILTRRLEERENACQQLQDQLTEEKKMRLEETQILARKLAEKTKFAENLNVKLEEAFNENKVMKRRHITSIKELSRELYHTKKRLDALEAPGNTCGSAGAGDTTSLGSRTSSSGSLDAMAGGGSGGVNHLLVHNGSNHLHPAHPVHLPQPSHHLHHNAAPQVGFSGQNSSGAPGGVGPLHKESLSAASSTASQSLPSTNLVVPPSQPSHINGTGNINGGNSNQLHHNINSHQTQPPPPGVLEIDRQVLIERIVRLQKTLARKNDKMEFLEEHVTQLLNEIKKKARIIQNYILREESGALIPLSMDQNKAELSRHKGIMASVYKSQLSDNNLTFELLLEINQKLQAVLEDTLLKNITLKENINTLGEEIARISKEQHDLQTSWSSK